MYPRAERETHYRSLSPVLSVPPRRAARGQGSFVTFQKRPAAAPGVNEPKERPFGDTRL